MATLLDCKIKQRSIIYASPEKIYNTITNAQEWDKFFTTGMELDPRPGGVCMFAWKDWGPDKYTLKAPGKVVEVDPSRLFAFEWGSEGKATTVRFELEPFEGGTVVTVIEDGYQNTQEGRAMIVECASGWGEAVTLLKFYLEHGITYYKAMTTA